MLHSCQKHWVPVLTNTEDKSYGRGQVVAEAPVAEGHTPVNDQKLKLSAICE